MKQNIYDDLTFFENYGKMRRSTEGLNAAGEWYILRNMLPDLKQKTVLDLGCGYGWHCIYAKQQGAEKVIGIDLSKNMIDKAKQNSKGLSIEYKQVAIEDFDMKSEKFDVVISSLAFHYLKDLAAVFKKVHQTLKIGGSFVFTMEHPVFTAKAEQDWFADDSGKPLHWPIDNYYDENMRQTQFLEHKVIKYHRTMETIINTVIHSNFNIKEISEPKPSGDLIKKYPEMKDEIRRPIFIMISATKK